MKTKREEINKTVIAALVGSVVALILSPLMLSVSFFINEYLSRPILTIEYVETLAEEEPVPVPTSELRALLGSEGYRISLMRGMSTDPRLMLFQGREEDLVPEELKTLIEATQSYIDKLSTRLHMLKELHDVLLSNPDESQIQEVATKYAGAAGQFFPTQQNASSLKPTLIAKIGAESDSLNESLQLANSLNSVLSTLKSGTVGELRLKISLLNRGNTDGLIRNFGRFTLIKDSLTLPLIRSNQPRKPQSQSISAFAVPVSVTNPTEEPARKEAVGKVEKNSMAEFWFQIDKSAASSESLDLLWEKIRAGGLDVYRVTLLNHENEEVEYISK